MSRASRTFILVALVVLAASGQPTGQSCITCTQGWQPPAGKGPSFDGRRIISIYIDAGNPTPERLWNAVEAARVEWNNSTDGNSNKTGYYFVVDQSQTYGTPDVTVKFSYNNCFNLSPVACSAHHGGTTGTGEMEAFVVRNWHDNTATDLDLKVAVGHEIGHKIGLHRRTCGASIMAPFSPEAHAAMEGVMEADVAAANAAMNNPEGCTGTGPQTVEIEGGWSPTRDDDNDGWSPDDPEPDSDCEDQDDQINPGHMINCDEASGNHEADRDCSGTSDWQELDCENDPDWNPPGSPIVIDLSGNGFALTNGVAGVLFDLDGDGTPNRIPWTAPTSDDAWLALDRNGNGAVDNGMELFGNFTPQHASAAPNGFRALSVLNEPSAGGNGDRWIDHRDAVFSHLRLWVDSNHDGVSQASELRTLASQGIERISLEYRWSRHYDRWGNQFRYRAEVVNSTATGGPMAYDVFFAVRRRPQNSANSLGSLRYGIPTRASTEMSRIPLRLRERHDY